VIWIGIGVAHLGDAVEAIRASLKTVMVVEIAGGGLRREKTRLVSE
jgi:hypothetical protein